MKHLYRSTAFFAAVGLFFSVPSYAQLVQHAATCNACTTAQVEALLPICSQGYQYVGDFASDHLYRGCYKVKGTNPYMTPYLGTPRTREYFFSQPPASEQNTFQAYQNVYSINGQVLHANAKVSVNAELTASTPLGDDGYMNAYDALHATQNMDTVRAWLLSTSFTPANTTGYTDSGIASPQLSAAVAELLNNIKSSLISFSYNVNVIVVFHDGSQMTFAFDNQNGRWDFVKGTARDAHGNLIPDSYDAIGGNNGNTYNFVNRYPGYDLTNFLGTLQLDSIQPTGNSATRVLACVTVGKVTTCKYVTIEM